MKKYLMIGIAAVAMTAAFTSCSKDKDFEQVSQVQLDESKYQAAFESRFGKIDPNHDWGFNQFKKGANARVTRTAYPNGNMWASEGWKVPPVISTDQKNIVRQYFQQVKPIGYNDPQWSNFWIQQVYKGGSNAGEGSGSLTTETYTIGNGDAVVGGNHMDHLCSKSQAGVEDHVNDFNNSDNNDWEGRMLMINSSTYSFGYINSNATAIHYDKAALVNWRVIAQWAVDKGLESSVESSVLNDEWNRSYMGFDWEQALPDDCYAKGVSRPDENGNWQWHPDEYNTFEFEGNTYKFLSANANQYAYDESEPTYGGKQNYNDRPSDAIIRDLLSKGYLPYSDTLKDWIKLSTGADGYYSDWIVTLTEAQKNNVITGDVRVIVEDMKAADEWDGVQFKGDFDFNDVVFDVVYDYDDKQSAIILQAAGGTLPLYLTYAPSNFSVEVHQAFGGYDTGEMINTGAGPNEAPKLLKLGAKINDARDIVVTVEVPSAAAPVELKAEEGRAPHKIAVPITFEWMSEWLDIETKYPGFSSYVQDRNVSWAK